MCDPTADHGEIMAWALQHGATPAEIMPRKFDREPSMLHFLFGDAGAAEPEIQPIAWEAFFAMFDLLGLKMTFDDSPSFELLQPRKASIYPSHSRMGQ